MLPTFRYRYLIMHFIWTQNFNSGPLTHTVLRPSNSFFVCAHVFCFFLSNFCLVWRSHFFCLVFTLTATHSLTNNDDQFEMWHWQLTQTNVLCWLAQDDLRGWLSNKYRLLYCLGCASHLQEAWDKKMCAQILCKFVLLKSSNTNSNTQPSHHTTTTITKTLIN